MRSSRLSVSLSAGVAAIAAIFAGALIWLLLSDPVSVADAVETGEMAPLVARARQCHLPGAAEPAGLSVRKGSERGARERISLSFQTLLPDPFLLQISIKKPRQHKSVEKLEWRDAGGVVPAWQHRQLVRNAAALELANELA